jgi:hypothetical protein
VVDVTNSRAQGLYSKLGYTILWDNISAVGVAVENGIVYPAKRVLEIAMNKQLR